MNAARVLAPCVQVRRAGPEDLELLRRIHVAAMRPHVERVHGPWDDAAQRKRFFETTDATTHEVVERDGRPVGCRWVRDHGDQLELVRLWLLPEAQGAGLGGLLVWDLLARADPRPVRLRVLRGNPARALYERMGFRVVGETDTHHQMRWEGPVPSRPRLAQT